jgi:hypothetical protein
LKGDGFFKRTPRTADRCSVCAILLAVLAAALLGGCSGLTGVVESEPGIPEDPAAAAEALSVIAKLQQVNGALKTFKGVGRLTVRHEGKVQVDERMAWVGALPLKLSVVLFAASFPALRMAGDGEWLYYQDGQEPGAPVKRMRASDPDFKRILSIPILASDIIALMCGKMPLKEHTQATIRPLASGQGYVLLLMDGRSVRQKIFFDETKSETRQTEVYDSWGKLVFQANFLEMQVVNGYRVPSRLVVSRGKDATVQVLVEKYWADIPVTPETFVLAVPPG